MDENEELKQELETELQWVRYRMKVLDIIDRKLMQMREMTEQAKERKLSPTELEVLTVKINKLAAQVSVLDEESRKIEWQGIDK
jgi:hypothetical protein